MRVLRIYPGANDPRHRRRDLALLRAGVEVGLVMPERYGADLMVGPMEPTLRHWRGSLINSDSIPFHLWPWGLLGRAVREFEPDLVDIHEEPFFPACAQAVAAAGRLPIVMYTAQNLEKSLPLPIAAMQRWVFKRTRAIYGTSQGAIDLVRKRGFAGHGTVIPIGVEEELFEARPHGDRIGFVGRFLPMKGIDDLLPFGRRLLCIGDGPMKPQLLAAGAEVRRATTIDELRAALEEMAVLAAPSRTAPHWKEQFGRMAVEAMAAGVPVVAYASGSLEEVIGDAGILVPEGQSEKFREAVLEAVATRAVLAARGRARARRLFTWEAVAAQMIEMYGRALGD